MTRVSLFSSFISLTFLIACFSERSGSADPLALEASPEPRNVPGLWVVLDGRPFLSRSPEEVPAEEQLRVEALERVEVVRRTTGGELSRVWLEVKTPEQSGWLPEALLAPPPLEIDSSMLQTIGREPVNRYHGLPSSYVPNDLTTIRFGYESDRTYRLRRDAAAACEKMIRRARRDGIQLAVVSAYRSYETQRRIYLNKLRRSGWNQNTVAKPGHSEHQLGTTVDFAGSDDSTLLRASFADTPAGRWLREHAPKFGFAVSYTESNRRLTGYAPEPWHFRYYGADAAGERHRTALGIPTQGQSGF